MSGIGGVRAFSAEPLVLDPLREMAHTLRHRGPDGSSVWVDSDIGLTHTDAANVGVEPSDQPMISADARWAIALDGVIANHQRLRASLDYPFQTRSDAEVVLAGLTLEGISFVERLHGQFAFVAHDRRTDTTHLVRDRLGTRPLHYRHIPGGIAFGSEVKALLAVGPAPEVDQRSLDAYLTSRVVPAPDTLFEGVKQVRPAHRVSLMPRGHVEEGHYWTPPEQDPDGVWRAGDAVEALSDGLREAVRAALVSSERVGVHLTGGIDSSLIIAMLRELSDGPVHTFSFGFDERSGSESDVTRRIGSLMGTVHHDVRISRTDVEDHWARLTWFRDAPVPAPGDIATYVLARAARERAPVLFTADGGDELFGRHPHDRLARFTERSAALSNRLRSHVVPPVERRLGATFSSTERERLLGSLPPVERQRTPALGSDPADRSLRSDLQHWLPDHVLTRRDRMSMAASLEPRPVLLDHRLVELVLRMPTSVKVRGGSMHWLLREVARPVLSEEICNHSVGARLPADQWWGATFRHSARDRLMGVDSWIAQTLDRHAIRDLIERHDRDGSEGARLWALLGLEMWHDCFFGSAPVLPSPRRGSPPIPAPGQAV